MARSGVIGSRAGTTRRGGWVTRGVAAAQGGDAAITLGTDVAQLSSELAQDAATAVSRSFEERVPVYLEKVRATWPVLTGYSKGQFRLAVKRVDAFFQLSIVNLAYYSGWIRQKDETPKLAAVRVLFDPFDPVATEIARDIAEYLGD